MYLCKIYLCEIFLELAYWTIFKVFGYSFLFMSVSKVSVTSNVTLKEYKIL